MRTANIPMFIGLRNIGPALNMVLHRNQNGMSRIFVRRILRGSEEHREAIKQLQAKQSRKMSGRAVALSALNGSPTSELAIAYRDGQVVGAANWRITDEGVKRINTGVLKRKSGIGSSLIRFIIASNRNMPMWTKSHPQSWGFCAALGMTPGEVLENGSRI